MALLETESLLGFFKSPCVLLPLRVSCVYFSLLRQVKHAVLNRKELMITVTKEDCISFPHGL